MNDANATTITINAIFRVEASHQLVDPRDLHGLVKPAGAGAFAGASLAPIREKA